MTVICWDGKTLAADRQLSCGHSKLTMTKLFRVKDGILGVAGKISEALAFVEWFSGGRLLIDYPDILKDSETNFEVLFIKNDKHIFSFDGSPYGIPLTDKIVAIGSGGESALVAMACKKTSKEAVSIVSKYNSSCGNGCDTLTL